MSKHGCTNCGGKKFFAHQIVTISIIVDENNDFDENNSSTGDIVADSAETPFGPYTCCFCGDEWDEIPTLPDEPEKEYCLGCGREVMTESGQLCDICKAKAIASSNTH